METKRVAEQEAQKAEEARREAARQEAIREETRKAVEQGQHVKADSRAGRLGAMAALAKLNKERDAKQQGGGMGIG